MTTITFHSVGERLTGFTVTGHSGYAEAGTDIVCAAITSAVRLVECAVNDVLGLAAAVKVRGDTITLKLPGGLGDYNEQTCQTLLASLMLYLTQLQEEHPENVLVLDGDV